MIQKEEVFAAYCDVCLMPLENSDGIIPMFHVQSDCVSNVQEEDEWLIGDGQEGELGKHYCGSCWSRDDQDVVHIKTVAAGSGYLNL